MIPVISAISAPPALPRRTSRAPRRLRAKARTKARAGFTLVETMVAMVLFAIATLGLAGMSVVVARRAMTSAATTARGATMGEQVDRLQAMPFDSLAARAGCTVVTGPPLPHTRCVSIAALPNNKIQIRLIVTPMDPRLRADTTTFTRARGAKDNPLT
jgi:prepilin-type N-terminal cleavage/methylation domain-containing protein